MVELRKETSFLRDLIFAVLCTEDLCLRDAVLSGQMAPSDQLSEEALYELYGFLLRHVQV